jgi:hypothetical protein
MESINHSPSAIDWARLAAFIDGEGSIRVNIQCVKNTGTKARFPIYALNVNVCNTDVRLMVWLSGLFGGTVETKKNGGGRRRTLYVWRVLAAEHKRIIEGCMPYLVLKREQADLALSLLALVDKKRRPRTPEKIQLQDGISRKLNHLNLTRGVDKQARLPMVQ